VEVRQILLRTDTAANWSSVNPVLGAGEIGTESDTTLQKVGDGVTAWNSLPYKRVDLTVSRNGTTVTVGATGNDAVLPAATTSLAGVMSGADKTKLDSITTLGDVSSGANNVFTGANSFLDSSGQAFGTDTAAEDGIIIAGRAGGSSSYRVTLRPDALSGNRQLIAPDRSGTIITSADSGTVTSAMIAPGAIVNDDINAAAGIADSKLATISTAGKVANSATTAASSNTASAIVARDASGNFSAGTITAALSGNASTATTLQTPRNINGVSFNGSANITITANTGNGLTFNSAGSGGASGSTFNGGSALTVSYNTVGAPSTTGTGASGTWGISVTGNAATAAAWATGRTITLTGDVTGVSGGWTGSGNISFATAIAAGSIVDADVSAAAAIAGTKINPNFGSQAVSGGGLTLSGDITFSRTSPAGISVDDSGRITLSTDTNATASTSAINFNIDGAEVCDISAGGYLRFDRVNNFNAGICSQTNDSLLAFGGGENPSDSGLNIILSGPDRVSSTGYLMRWNSIILYQYDKTSDYHAWYTGTGNERMRITSNGHLGIGTTIPGPDKGLIRIAQSITGAVDITACAQLGVVQSDVTTAVNGYQSFIGTAASAFALGNLRHFRAGQGTIGEGSSVTNQFGFFADASLTGATDNYGFYGNIPAATGSWNFYAAGTAPNYFAGGVRSNTTVSCRSAPTNSNTSVTITAASMLDGVRTGTPAANITYTLPTGANMDAAFQELQTNQSFEWSVINLAAATHSITVAENAGNGHTVVGNTVVAANSSGRFLTRKSAANTFITYRIA
jgi:hypothetical protein